VFAAYLSYVQHSFLRIQAQRYGRNVDWKQPCDNVGTKWNGSSFVNQTTGTESCVFDSVFNEFILKTHAIVAKLNRTATGWHETWRHLGTRLPKSSIIHMWLGTKIRQDLHRHMWMIDDFGTW
jgi:hypothetical protein